MPDKLCLKGSRNPLEMARSLAYKMRFRKEHPDFFDPCGLMVFCGPQGCKARAMRAKKAARSPLKIDRTGAVKRFHCPQRRSSIGRLRLEPHRRKPVSCGRFSGKYLPNASILI